MFECKVCNRYTNNNDHDCSHRRSIKGKLLNKYYDFLIWLDASLRNHRRSMDSKYWKKYIKDDSWN